MRSGRAMVNLPVILLSRGTRVGTVRDLVIDLDRRVVAALLLVENAPSGRERFLPFHAIRRVGPHAVMAQDGPEVADEAERGRLRALSESPVNVVGMKVLTEDGRLLGAVSDVLLDEVTGALEQYEVSGGHLRDLLSGRIYLSSAAPRALGDEFMVVPETATASEPAQPRDGPPLLVEAPPWIGTEVRPTQVEQAAVGASGAESPEMVAARRGAARSLWDQVGERVGWLTGRR